MQYCYIDQELKLEKEAFVSINERGFLFGDGIFETCLVHNEKVYNLPAHLNRLKNGLEAIKISFGLESLENNIKKLITKNTLKEGLVRIYVSRGIGSNGYSPIKNTKPLIIIQTKNLPQIPQTPIKLFVSKIQKISYNSLPINYKLAQGLNSTLAKIEAQENNCFDSLLLNHSGKICETSSANIFWIKDAILYTPSTKCEILIGTTRNKILELAQIETKEVSANLEELANADEIFVTNASYGVLNINELQPINRIFTQNKYSRTLKKLLEEDINQDTSI